jgi:hypothetical protein
MCSVGQQRVQGIVPAAEMNAARCRNRETPGLLFMRKSSADAAFFRAAPPGRGICAMPANRSHDAPTVPVKTDKEREMQDSIIEDAPKNDGADRDLVHGDGGTLGLPTKPEDLNQDD